MVRYRRYLIALAIMLVLLGAYAAAGFWAVPYFARTNLQKFVHAHYGRQLSVGEIRFNPFTLTLEVGKLSLPDADGKVLVAFEHLHVRLQFASLWHFAPRFDAIVLEQPYVRAVIRPSGELNLADLGKGFPPEPPRAQPQKESQPLRLYIRRLAVLAGSTVFEDHTRAPVFAAEFKPIAFQLLDFSTRGGSGNDYTLSAVSEAGERLNWSGTVDLAPLASRGKFEISDVKARTVWSYLRDVIPFEIDSGSIGLNGEYELAKGGVGGPLTLKLAVHDTKVTKLGAKPKGGAEHYVHLDTIEVGETRVDVTGHSVDIGRVKVTGGELKVWVDPGQRVNLRDLVSAGAGPAPSASGPAAPAAAGAPSAAPVSGAAAAETPAAHARSSGGNASPWRLAAPDASVQGLKVSFEDREVEPAAAITLAPVSARVTGFSTAPDDVIDISIDTGVNDSGKLSAKAKVTLHDGNAVAQAEASSLPLTVAQPYLSRYTSMTLLKGTLATKLTLEHHPDDALDIKADARLADLRTVDNTQKRDFVTWRDVRIAGLRYQSKPQSLRVASVTAVEPYVRMIIFPDRTLNMQEVLTPPGKAKHAGPAPQQVAASEGGVKAARKKKAPASATPSKPAEPVVPFPLTITTVRFVNATADYTDLWIKPSFAVGLQSLSGTVTGLSSDPATRAKVQLDGKIDKYAPAKIAGEVNLLSAALYTDITLGFKDVDLTIVNPYSGHFVGYKIDKGKLSVDVTYHVEHRKLDAKQHFVVDQLELGDRVDSPDAIHAPVKLAVALLKDRDGVIDIDLPMSGTLDDPQFRIGPIIWKAFVNLIVKAATAPFALLGHLFGGGEHVNIIEFAPGSAQLDEGSKNQLTSIAKSLAERPQLKLDVPIVYSATVDRPELAAQRLKEKIAERAQGTRSGRKHPETAAADALAEPKRHYELLVDEFREEMGKDAALPESVQAVQAAKRKDNPPYDQAISDLDAALLDHVAVSDADLEELGRQRARAIQDVLLADGKVEASRVFIVQAQSKADGGDKVKVELALK
ncbi:MAG TPA: DUF748 domain-containing protein [Steroidobacteraceae bacterium]|nr:DUF748 domain-containing protein [Steroidobacteraceae bacterium]